MNVAFLATDMVEQVELTEPWRAVEEAGWTPRLVSLRRGEIQGFDHYDKADTFAVDETVADADPSAFDALVIPGGVGNPDELRTSPDAVAFVRSFVESGKPIASICHGPWLLVEAGAVDGRALTSWPSLQDRHPQRRRRRGSRRGGRGRRPDRHQPPPGRPARVLREAEGRVPRGRPQPCRFGVMRAHLPPLPQPGIPGPDPVPAPDPEPPSEPDPVPDPVI